MLQKSKKNAPNCYWGHLHVWCFLNLDSCYQFHIQLHLVVDHFVCKVFEVASRAEFDVKLGSVKCDLTSGSHFFASYGYLGRKRNFLCNSFDGQVTCDGVVRSIAGFGFSDFEGRGIEFFYREKVVRLQVTSKSAFGFGVC